MCWLMYLSHTEWEGHYVSLTLILSEFVNIIAPAYSLLMKFMLFKLESCSNLEFKFPIIPASICVSTYEVKESGTKTYLYVALTAESMKVIESSVKPPIINILF